MFNDDQENKIKIFASITKVTNLCFSKCIISLAEDNKLTSKEKDCLRQCSNNYIELNHNIKNQLKIDKERIEEKNKYILENKT